MIIYLARYDNLNCICQTTGLQILCTFFAIGLTHLTRCVKIQIGMVNKLIALLQKNKKSEAIYRQDSLNKIGREQFRKLTERGIDLPVVLL